MDEEQMHSPVPEESAPENKNEKRPPRTITLRAAIAVTLACVLIVSGALSVIYAGNLRRLQDAMGAHRIASQAADVISRYFVGELDDTAMLTNAIDAMVATTGDKWSYYVPVEELQEFNDNRANSYVGIGVTVVSGYGEGPGLLVTQVIPGGSAEEGGILAGEYITAVDGTDITGMTAADARELIIGEEGTYVTITVTDESGASRDLSLQRRKTQEMIATAKMVGTVGYVLLENFNTGSAEKLTGCVSDLLEQGAQAIVIDLRFNPGGFLAEMQDALDYFLPAGDRFVYKDYNGKEYVDSTDTDGECLDVPLAVLVNDNSYSAAEYFAAALREYERATVVGTQTPGKGRAQTPHYLADGSCIMLSTLEYVTPGGVSLALTGITPDVVVDISDEAYEKLSIKLLPPEEDPQLQAAIEAITK